MVNCSTELLKRKNAIIFYNHSYKQYTTGGYIIHCMCHHDSQCYYFLVHVSPHRSIYLLQTNAGCSSAIAYM